MGETHNTSKRVEILMNTSIRHIESEKCMSLQEEQVGKACNHFHHLLFSLYAF